MIQLGRGTCLTNEPRFCLLVACESRWQEFDGYATIQLGIFRQENRTHPACSQRPDNLIMRNLLQIHGLLPWQRIRLLPISDRVLAFSLGNDP